MKLNRVGVFLVVGAVFIAIGVVVGLTVNVFPVRASAEASSVDALFGFMLAIAVVVFLIVEGGIIYTIIRFRKRKSDPETADGIPMHGNTALEITWTTIPAIIVFVLAIYSYQVFVETRSPGADDLAVGVIGQQFVWNFVYPVPFDDDPAVTDEVRERIATFMTSPDLHLPINRSIRMDIEAQDVLHSFFIPEFRIKQDAIPGRVSNAYFTPTETGTWWVRCAELCGAQHGQMSLSNQVIVQEQAEYDQFINALYAQAKANALNPRSAEVGRQLLTGVYPCWTCHIIPGTGRPDNVLGPGFANLQVTGQDHADAGGSQIPPFDENALNSTLANYLRASIVNPNAWIVPGYPAGLMPQNYGDPNVMPRDHLEAIINYLVTLRQP